MERERPIPEKTGSAGGYRKVPLLTAGEIYGNPHRPCLPSRGAGICEARGRSRKAESRQRPKADAVVSSGCFSLDGDRIPGGGAGAPVARGTDGGDRCRFRGKAHRPTGCPSERRLAGIGAAGGAVAEGRDSRWSETGSRLRFGNGLRNQLLRRSYVRSGSGFRRTAVGPGDPG
jgi:hypothetical protein